MRLQIIITTAVVAAAGAVAGTVAALAAPLAPAAPAAHHATTAMTRTDRESRVAGRSTIGAHGMLAHPIPCGQDQTVWGYLGLVRPGESAAARHANVTGLAPGGF